MGGFNPAWFLGLVIALVLVLIAESRLSSGKRRALWCVATLSFAVFLGGMIWDFFAANKAQALPDVTLRFVYPKEPALQLVNQSDALARDIKYVVALWNLDLPDRRDPLPIPVAVFDWIKPHEVGGPQDLFFTPTVTPLLSPGNHLFGSMAVSCPNCMRGHTYIVYIVWGQDGWVAEMPDEKKSVLLVPKHFTKEEIAAYVGQLVLTVPEDTRTPIGEP